MYTKRSRWLDKKKLEKVRKRKFKNQRKIYALCRVTVDRKLYLTEKLKLDRYFSVNSLS